MNIWNKTNYKVQKADKSTDIAKLKKRQKHDFRIKCLSVAQEMRSMIL